MRILLATDGSEPADRARDFVTAMPWPRGSSIRVISVVPGEADVTPRWTEDTARLPQVDRYEDPRVRAHAVALDSAERDLALAHPDALIERLLLRGRAATVIVEEAREMEADLIVVGHRGHGTIETMLLGSVSAEVVDHAPCPVLVVRSAERGSVVLADDGSPSALSASAALEALPLPPGLPVTVLSVVDTDFPFGTSGAPGMYDAAMASYRKSLGEARAEIHLVSDAAVIRLERAGYRATAVVREGDPAHEIVAFAKERKAGLLVLGTRGQTGLRRLLLGSVARNVLLHAPCSVLVVRESVVPRSRAEEREPVLAGAASEPPPI